MGELMNQLHFGGPGLISLENLPQVRRLLDTPGVRWELERMDADLRDRLSRLSPGAASHSALFFYAEFRSITQREGPLSETEARCIASCLTWELEHLAVTAAFREAVRAHADWAQKHGGERCVAAAAALIAAIPEKEGEA